MGATGHDFRRDEATMLREIEALRLRATGKTLQQVAVATGYATKSGAKRAIDRILADVKFDAVDEYRRLELARLEATIARVSKVMYGSKDEHVVVAAARELRRLSESIRKMLGLDAPSRRIVEVITEDVIDAELRQLNAEMAELTGDAATSD